MNEKFKTPKRRRRRNCYDRLRARWLENRRRQRADPAASAVAQMMAMFVVLIGRMPLVPASPVPAPYVPPPLSPGQAHRNAVARRLGVPGRYVDVVLAQGTVPYGQLFEHVRRGGRSRNDAMTVLRQRAPEACRDWLDHVQDWGLWSSLLACHVREGADEDTDVKLLKSTLTWLRDLNPGGCPPAPAEAGVDLIPGPDEDPGNDPNRTRGVLT
ncbi:hypothetical protein ELH72_29675 (plasmid) [Rhizobium ruizarguesonis]|uniref:hypothetical protein n=1 Tax=Rhizobium ruizarguesonis TaxID=2081791 RepID=UPI0010310798|nr:hypothetical protein [Rhizobium ruizarguesonis]TAZ71098.1 hypothetical protein ELH72_29675 [Rhizobium ruizarguesonis]